MASFTMYGRSWQVPAGMTKAEAMGAVAAGRAGRPEAYLDPTADDQDTPGGAASYVGTSGAVPQQEAAAFEAGQTYVSPIAGQPQTDLTRGVTQPGAGLEGGTMPDYDSAGGYISPFESAASVGLDMPFAGTVGAGRALVPYARSAGGYVGMALSWLGARLAGAAGIGGAAIAAESLLPGENIPFTPSGAEIAETVGDWAQTALDLMPGGMVPGERKTRERVLQAVSVQTGVQITALTQLPQGGWMGSYLSSPNAKKKRGFYIGPGGFPIRTWANRGMAVISRDPRGSALSKGARALDKATNRFVRADKVADKVKKRIRTKARK